MMGPVRKKVAFVMTVPGTLRSFMSGHLAALSVDYDVTVFLNLATDDCRDAVPDCVQLVHVPFERKVHAVQDLKCLLLLFRHLRRGRFDSVHSLMPKTGLLTMAAAFPARTPVRIHTFTGQVWVVKHGLSRHALKSFDKLIVALSTHILVDSPSQRDFLVSEGVLKQATVLGHGSIAGVDIQRFRPDPEDSAALRNECEIAADTVLFGFLGRLNRDKGVLDLVEAFSRAALPPEAHLMLVGRDEEGILDAVESSYGDLDGRLHVVGYTRQPQRYVNMFDVFCYPSYREGFGMAVIEAAASGVPAVASRIYGLTDAIEEGVTGVLHQAANSAEIASALERLSGDAEYRRKLGAAARLRVEKKFSSTFVVSKLVEFYERTV